MKKQQCLLIGITCIFICLIIGIFIGRNTKGNYISLNNTNTTDTTQSSQNNIGKIDINTATLQQLQLLPGIGEVTAQRILDYRNQQGSFSAIEELMNISGIGEKKFEQIKPYIIVGGSYENSGS